MTTKDLEKAIKISKEYREIYNRFVGLAGISDYVHLSFDAFMGLFNEFYIDPSVSACGDFRLSVEYDGVEVKSIANYDDMLKFPKTKEYLKEKLKNA